MNMEKFTEDVSVSSAPFWHPVAHINETHVFAIRGRKGANGKFTQAHADVVVAFSDDGTLNIYHDVVIRPLKLQKVVKYNGIFARYLTFHDDGNYATHDEKAYYFKDIHENQLQKLVEWVRTHIEINEDGSYYISDQVKKREPELAYIIKNSTRKKLNV